MRKIIIVSILTLGLVSAGCQEWLDVQPKTTTKQDKLFESESGFRDALVGCYMLMGEQGLYGRELTVTLLEVLAQQYEMHTQNSYYTTARYEYENMDSRFASIWSGMYGVVANLNAILDNIDGKRHLFTPTTYAIIKGEALGLRAMIHFDLLRMFGPGNLAAVPANLDRPAIPYVTRYDKNTTPQHTVRKVLEFINADLDEAERLLYLYDGIRSGAHADDYQWPSVDPDAFYSNRRSRMNYYAVKALRGRVYMWEGRYKDALDNLQTVQTAVQWIDPNRSITGEAASRDYKATVEAFFSLNLSKQYESLRPYVESYSTTANFTVTQNYNYFFHTQARADKLYETTTIGRGDWRYGSLYNTNLAEWTFLKYTDSEQWAASVRNHVVLIRKPEVFYMAAECHNRLGDGVGAAAALNEVRVSRGIAWADNLDGKTMTAEEIDAEIEKEYAKEFIGEGVMFYYYKRLNKIIPGSNQPAEDKVFIFPLPVREVETGGRKNP